MRRIFLLCCLSLFYQAADLSAAKYPFLNQSEQPFDLFKKPNSQEAVDPENPARVDIVASTQDIAAGEPFWVAVRMDIADGWKAYWKNPGESGLPMTVEWVLPKGFVAGELLYPTPTRSVVNNFVVYGYSDEVVLLAKITPPTDLKSGEKVDIAADVRWLVCSDSTCLPGDSYQELTLQTAESATVDPKRLEAFDKALALMPKEAPPISLAEATSEKIVLHLDEGEAKEAVFFPDSDLGIDLKREPVVIADPQGGQYITIYRAETATPPKALQGVLVLDDSGSWQIDVPLEGAPAPKREGPGPLTPIAEDEYSYGMILFLAFVGGMILNLMPCVLPVISIKVLGFVQMANKSRKATFLHGLLFSIGVLISFWVLAGMMLILQSYGQAVGWGFQLQDATFVAVLTAVLLVAALVFFGVLELGLGLATAAGGAMESVRKKESGKLSSFFSGVLATALATPCSGPFLGMVLGIAVTLPWYSSLMIFTMLGLGMAFPYLILSANPKWLKFLPKPGPWMDTFKQLMGFLLLLTVIWLLWVFMAQSDSQEMLRLLIALFIISFGAWVFGHFGSPMRSSWVRRVAFVVGIALIAFGFYEAVVAGRQSSVFESHEKKLAFVEEGWERFSPERVAELRAQGTPIFIDFTAKWCLLCQSNLISLMTPAVEAKMEELGVVKMMADWTRSDPVITAELKKFGRNSVPLYIYYPPGVNSEPHVLPQVLTPDTIQEYLQK
jgi:thiol:disulfide interchange protein DsbD